MLLYLKKTNKYFLLLSFFLNDSLGQGFSKWAMITEIYRAISNKGGLCLVKRPYTETHLKNYRVNDEEQKKGPSGI